MGFHGVGETRADLLLDKFGEELPRVLRDPDAVRDELVPVLAQGLPSLGPVLAWRMHATWADDESEYTAMAWLEGLGVGGDSYPKVRRVVRLLGAEAPAALARNPYGLVSALPWSIVDRIGRAVLAEHHGHPEPHRASQRLAGAVDAAWSAIRSDGHTAATDADMRARLARLLGRELVDEAMAVAERKRRIVRDGDLLRSPGARWMEEHVMARLAEWAGDTRDEFRASAVAANQRAAYGLSEEQEAALAFVLGRRFAAVAGGAGTGKTALARAVVAAWREMTGGSVVLATLSGKAAFVLSRATGTLAKTVYRTLAEIEEVERAKAEDPEHAAALVQKGKTSLDDRTLVLVDEASMVALGDWMRLTGWIEENGASLAMLGDSGQLPPVGPGLVFHVIAQDDRYTARLQTIHRHTEAGGIPVVARAIRQRARDIPWKVYEGAASGVARQPCRRDESVDVAVRVAGEIGSPGEDVQLVAATNATVDRINRLFHDRYRGEEDEVRGPFGDLFSPGDPVVHLRNDYKAGLFNGLLGRVEDVDRSRGTVTVVFEEAEHTFERKDLSALQLGYCLTCHKMQGSQAERVVVIVENVPRLLEPTWVYTAITRATEQVVVIGTDEDVDASLRRTPAFRLRTIGGGALP
jgi:exodeoxyribonuclease V alpha subunit